MLILAGHLLSDKISRHSSTETVKEERMKTFLFWKEPIITLQVAPVKKNKID